MPQDRPPRRLRLARVPSESKPGRHVLPQAVSTQLIDRLLSAAGATQALELGLEELIRELPGVEQAFLWMREGLNRFSLQVFRGVPKEALPALTGYEGVEAVLESSLKTAYLGSPEGWLGGRVHLDREGHVLHRVLGALPAELEPATVEPGVNLTLPLVANRQVWAVLHLYAPARFLGQAEVDLVNQYVAGVAPILREVYLREAAERQSLWLSAVNTLLRASHEQPLETGLQDALEEATRLSGAEGARLIAFEGHAIRTIAQAGWGAGLPVEAAITRQLGERLRSGQQVGIPRYDLYPNHRPELVEAGLRSLFILPILRKSSEVSALLLFSTQQHRLPDTLTQELLSDMAAAIGVVRVEWTLRRELAWAAYTDPLTGLGNRRAFERDLEKLFDQAHDRKVVLVLLDLDGFKTINDTYGHVHADHVLVRLGGVLRSKARAGDRAYRLGGDEFALIIVGSSTLNPPRTAERYRALLEEIRISDSAYLRVSLGYAVYPTDVPDIQNLWRIADDQMYKDKALRKGRAPLFDQALEQDQLMVQLETPLFRTATRLGQALKIEPEEQQVLQASCYLLQLALGEIEAVPDVQIPDGLWREAARVLMFVHSRWDGGSRPLGLSGEQIPRAARVLQVAQQFTAALQHVEGRAALSVEEALEDIAREARQRFDPVVVEALRSIRGFLSDDSAA
ncbi:diguanylate cyclase [uncultured Meiothermus sp.]|uniref:diguanylate cyclase n=1 Tax=uncultured Meiothermus sp. TaxID=157471 RepID=UPI002622CFCC|nr:diguanylate cyclase [uncultured Meiothermus sp.]